MECRPNPLLERVHAHMQGGTSTNPDWVGSERHRRALSEANQDRRRAGCNAAGDAPERSHASPSSCPLKRSLWYSDHLRRKVILRIDEWGPDGLRRRPHIFLVLGRRSRRDSGGLVVGPPGKPVGLRQSTAARDTESKESLSLFMYTFSADKECQYP